MANQLGQLLLQQKLVTPSQLEEALKNQAIFGGRLGSQLVDSGALEERELAKILGQLYRVAYAHSAQLANLPEEVLTCIPQKLVEQFLVLPLKRENKRLYLAMADPANLAAIEEIGFRTGFVIRPVVTPETALVKHLKRYYGIDRPGGYIVMDPPDEPHDVTLNTQDANDSDTWLGGPEQDAIMEEWERKNLEMRNGAPSGPPEKTAKSWAPPERLGEQLATSLDREKMADLIADHLAREYGSGALLLVRGDTLLGWRGVNNQAAVAEFGHFQLDLKQPSALQTAALSKSTYVGPLAALPANQLIAAALGHAPPEQVLIVPVVLLGRVVGLLYVDNPKLNLPGLRSDLQKLAAMLALGLEMLILKNKLSAM